MLIKLVPDTVVLPGVRVLAKRVNLLRDTTAPVLRLPGVPHVEHPQRAKPMTWTWGRRHFSDDAPPLPVIGVSASLSGPISYFMPYERDQRKYEREQRTALAQRGYRWAISNETTRQQLINEFQLTDRQYDSLLILFNQARIDLVDGASEEEATATLFWFFHEALRPEP